MNTRHLLTFGACVLSAGILLAFEPPARLPLKPATTQAAPQVAPSSNNPAPILPKSVRPEPRPLSKRALREAALASTERPPLVSATIAAAPAVPQMVEGSRRPVNAAPSIALRLPNLLQTPPKRAVLAPGGNPVIAPAAPIQTPAVNNLQGTSAFGPLAPFTREIQIEVSTPPAPLPFDAEPYLQVPDMPDDRDTPATMPEMPQPPRLD